MKGTVFLISGFELNRTATHEQYRELRTVIKAKGYQVVPVDINWKQRTMSQFVEEFKSIYQQHANAQHNIIIGNSFGAMVAMITAPQLKPNKIILCSLSPFFAEDIPRFKPAEKLYKWFGKRRVEDFRTISAKAIAAEINKTSIKTVLFYGEQEKKMYKKLVERVIDTANDLKGSKLIEIKSAPHSFKDPKYIAAIKQALQ